jgi:hypothetical protein
MSSDDEPGTHIRFVDTPTTAENAATTEMFVDGVNVCGADFRWIDDVDYGPGIAIYDMATDVGHLRHGPGWKSLRARDD